MDFFHFLITCRSLERAASARKSFLLLFGTPFHAYIHLITYETQISAIKLTLYSADKTHFCPSAFSQLIRGLLFFYFYCTDFTAFLSFLQIPGNIFQLKDVNIMKSA